MTLTDDIPQVCHKLDDDAQSELAGIVSQKVKEEGLMEVVDTGVSFESEPNKDHIFKPVDGKTVSMAPRALHLA